MTRTDRVYILRIAKGEDFGDDDEFVPVVTFTIEKYQCGIRAGDHVRLLNDFRVKDAHGQLIRVVPKGSIWTVLTGAEEDPDSVWLEEPEGELHSWDDNDRIFKTFEKLVV